MTNAEARFNKSLRPRKPEGSLGQTAQDVHLDSHTAPELWIYFTVHYIIIYTLCDVSGDVDFKAEANRIHMFIYPENRNGTNIST